MTPEHIESELARSPCGARGPRSSPAERRAVAEFVTGRPAGSYRAPIDLIPEERVLHGRATSGDRA